MNYKYRLLKNANSLLPKPILASKYSEELKCNTMNIYKPGWSIMNIKNNSINMSVELEEMLSHQNILQTSQNSTDKMNYHRMYLILLCEDTVALDNLHNQFMSLHCDRTVDA